MDVTDVVGIIVKVVALVMQTGVVVTGAVKDAMLVSVVPAVMVADVKDAMDVLVTVPTVVLVPPNAGSAYFIL